MTEADYAACREHVVRALRPRFPHDCEDAVQKAFVVLLGQPEPEVAEPFVDRLARVALKLLQAAASKRYRSRERLCNDRGEGPPSPGLDPEEALIARERAALVDRLLAELPPKSGEALRLSLEERETADIARWLGVPVEVFYSRLQYARREARRILKGWVRQKKLRPDEFLLLALWLGLVSEQSAHALPPPAPIAGPVRLSPRRKVSVRAVLTAASLAAGLLMAAVLGDSTPLALAITTGASRATMATAPELTGLGEALVSGPTVLLSSGTAMIESAELVPLRPSRLSRPAHGGEKPFTGGAKGAPAAQPPEWLLASKILQSARSQPMAEAARAAARFAKARPDSPHTSRLDATLRRGETTAPVSPAP